MVATNAERATSGCVYCTADTGLVTGQRVRFDWSVGVGLFVGGREGRIKKEKDEKDKTQ